MHPVTGTTRVTDLKALSLIGDGGQYSCTEMAPKQGIMTFVFKKINERRHSDCVSIKKIRGGICRFITPSCILNHYRGNDSYVYRPNIDSSRYQDEIFRMEIYANKSAAIRSRYPRILRDGSITIPNSYVSDHVDDSFEFKVPGVNIHMNSAGTIEEGVVLAALTIGPMNSSYSLHNTGTSWETGSMPHLVSILTVSKLKPEDFRYETTAWINITPQTPYGIMVFKRREKDAEVHG